MRWRQGLLSLRYLHPGGLYHQHVRAGCHLRHHGLRGRGMHRPELRKGVHLHHRQLRDGLPHRVRCRCHVHHSQLQERRLQHRVPDRCHLQDREMHGRRALQRSCDVQSPVRALRGDASRAPIWRVSFTTSRSGGASALRRGTWKNSILWQLQGWMYSCAALSWTLTTANEMEGKGQLWEWVGRASTPTAGKRA